MYLLARNNNDVEVLPLPNDMLSPKSIVQPANSETGQDLISASPSTQMDGPSELQHAALRPGNLLAESHMVEFDNESNCSKALLVTTTNNELKIESIVPGMSKNREHLHILSLPKSFSTENTAVNLQIPMSSTDSMRVIFNKRAAESYSLSDGRQGQFPSIVERKLTSIAQIGNVVPPHSSALDSPHSKRPKLNIGDVSNSREKLREWGPRI
jgi:hypothetical protein